MKKLLLLFAALILSSCIPVNDMGPFWDKGTIDPALAGTWQPDNPDNGDRTPVILKRDGDVYHLTTADGKEYAVRSLAVGKRNFFMIKPVENAQAKGGFIIRYERSNDALQLFYPTGNAYDFISMNYPKELGNMEDAQQKMMAITSLNQEAYKILSELPDSAWKKTGHYQKLHN